MATLAQFRTKFPQFASSEDETVEGFLVEAAVFIGGATLAQPDLCQLYLSAHFLAVNKNSVASGGREVLSQTIGRISKTFAHDSRVGIGDLSTTLYGRRYWDLRNIGIPKFKVIPLSTDVPITE